MKHSPGPWRWAKGMGGDTHETLMDAGGHPVLVVADYGALTHVDCDDADARLIAAAPELLEALRDAVDRVWNTCVVVHPDGKWERPAWLVNARALITRRGGAVSEATQERINAALAPLFAIYGREVVVHAVARLMSTAPASAWTLRAFQAAVRDVIRLLDRGDA